MFRDRYHDISTAFSFSISRFEYDVPLIIVRLIVEEIMIFDFFVKVVHQIWAWLSDSCCMSFFIVPRLACPKVGLPVSITNIAKMILFPILEEKVVLNVCKNECFIINVMLL